MLMDGVMWSEGEEWKHGKMQGRGWMGGAEGAGWKCGGGWEARDGCNGVGRDARKGTCIPGATLGIYGGKKIVSGEIVTPTCLCGGNYIYIHVIMY